MTFYTWKGAPAASAVELKNNNKSTKAKRILVGCDVHLRGYQAARKVDEGAIGVVDNFRSEEALLLSLEKQLQQAEQVVVVYEAGPLGDTLYRKLMATGVLCYVCAPDSSQQRKKRRKNNKIDARSPLGALPQTPVWGERFKAPSRFEQAEPAGGRCHNRSLKDFKPFRLWSGARPCPSLGEEPGSRLGVLVPLGFDAYIASCAFKTQRCADRRLPCPTQTGQPSAKRKPQAK